MEELLRVEKYALGIKQFLHNKQNQIDWILNDFCFKLYKNQIIGLQGPSGSGKSVFAKSLCGLNSLGIYQQGNFFYRGRSIQDSQKKSLRGKKIFYLPQHAAQSFNPLNKIKNQIRISKKLQSDYSFDMNSFFDPDVINRINNSYPFELSGGELQRCLLKLGFEMATALLILDEPTNSLDIPMQQILKEYIFRYRKRNDSTVLIISHRGDWLQKICDCILEIKDKQIILKK